MKAKPKRRLRGTGSYYFRTYKDRHGAIKKARFATLQYSVNGKTVKEKTKATTDKAAEGLLRKRLTSIETGEIVGPATDTVAQLLELVRDDYIANKRRADVLPRRIKHLSDAFGEVRADLLDEHRIAKYTQQRIKDGAKNATVNRELAALKRAFRLGARYRKVARVPFIAMLKEDNARTGFMERPDFLRIARKLDLDYRPVAWTAYITGWRTKSEIITRQRGKHLDFVAGWLRLEPGETKNKKGRQFPLIQKLRAVLEARERRTVALERELGRRIPWVFHKNGEPISMGAFYKAWKEAAHGGRIPHDFRRTAVRNLIRAGISQRVAMAMVGMETDSVFRRYAIVDETMLREAGNLLGLSLGLNASVKKLPRMKK